ncbi:MAG: hypothetical protein N2691_04390 [Patescibacteria group bacterium]|nr:hypothetical protein [Patescibacteria group bacterium]
MEEHPNAKLLIGLIAVSAVVLLLLIIAVMLLRKPAETISTAVVSPSPASSVPTVIISSPSVVSERIALPEDPVSRLKGLPFTLPATLPDDLWVTAHPNIDTELENYTVTMDTAARDFRITFSASRAPGETTLERENAAHPLPPVYRYRTTDFERIATINGVELLISKTGGVTLETGSDSAQLVATTPKVMTSEGSLEGQYYVYQKYKYGLSEYTNVFSSLKGEEPSYNDTVLIDYAFLTDAATAEWPERKALLQEVLTEIKPR